MRSKAWALGTIVITNLLPVAGVAAGWLTVVDVYLCYWVETVVIGVLGIVRILTATRGREPRRDRTWTAFLFALHYGLMTALLGVLLWMTVGLARDVTESLGWTGEGLEAGHGWLYVAVAIGLTHLTSLAVDWFGRDERSAWSPWGAMWAPYPHMLLLMVVGWVSTWVLLLLLVVAPVLLVVVLCALKLAVDLVLYAFDRRLAARAAARPRLPEGVVVA